MSRRIGVIETIALAIVVGVGMSIPGQSVARAAANIPALEAISQQAQERFVVQRGPSWARLAALQTGPYGKLNADPEIALMGIDEQGQAIYYGTDNINAARTTRADALHPGGISGYELTGANTFTMAVWDGGLVRASHQEFGGRVILQNTGTPADHGTHVAGTMAAAGVNGNAKGMSPEGYIFSYDWNNDDSEMASAASELNISNHSYSRLTGWRYSSGSWYWYGNPSISDQEDYGFGFYGSTAATWDAIAYNAPNYMICKSAGNDRGDGPGANETYYMDFGGGWQEMVGDPPPVDGGAEGWDCIAWYSTAKNIMTVGAVNDLPAGGYTGPGSVSMSGFSSFGPVDDGRIKPDIVANGVGLTSSYGGSDTEYASSSGTSMSTPNFAGTANLLFQHYLNTHEGIARASMMKAVIIHTADEAGDADGPDYRFGWGLMNAHAAADLISEDATLLYPMQDITLANDDTTRLLFGSTGEEPVRVTIAWTDPAGTPVVPSLDPLTPMLVNDLDLRLIDVANGTEHMPWTLDRDNPGNPATFGDNLVDNSEQVFVAEPAAGEYVIQVTHKGTLVNNEQVYSIVISGLSWLDDPRISPSNVTADLNLENGDVVLSWEQEGMESEEFENFSILRDGELIGTTTDLTFNDNLTAFATYLYEVQSNWTLGSSHPNPTVSVWWPAAISPIRLGYTILDTLAAEIELDWEQVRSQEQSADDGSVEANIYFSSASNPGLTVVRSFTLPENLDRITEVSAYLIEGDNGFGEIELVVFAAGEDDLPADELYRSDPFTPSDERWARSRIENGFGIEATPGATYFVGVVWQEPGTTELGLDTSSPPVPGSYFSANGTSWIALSEFVSGIFNGNPLLRTGFGAEDLVGENGLEGFLVYLNEVEAGYTTETRFEMTVNSSETSRIRVWADYEQGFAYSSLLEITPFFTSVEDGSLQPLSWEIGRAYPNPFNPTVAVPVTLAGRSSIQVTVFDVLGREVAAFSSGAKSAGHHTVSWEATGSSSGVYFLRIKAGPETALRKVVLMR